MGRTNSHPTATTVPARRVTLALLLPPVQFKCWSPQQTIRAFTLASCISSPPKKKISLILFGSQSLYMEKLLCKSSPTKCYNSHSHWWHLTGSEVIRGAGCGERRVCWSGFWSHSFEEWTVTATLNKQLNKCLGFCPAKPGSCRCGACRALGHTFPHGGCRNLSTHFCPTQWETTGGKEKQRMKEKVLLWSCHSFGGCKRLE